MCGIAGWVTTGESVDPHILSRMTNTLIHRGPDDDGYFVEGPVGLGFRRLAIIDLAGGRQPMSNEDETLWIVFNGEIYNFQELRRSLETTGRHRFKTRSDTEVILHLYEEHAEGCLPYLRGMFAFALWDKKRARLFLARDRIGKKPLVYAHVPGGFLFASETKALLEHPAISRDISPQAIDLFLTYQYIPSPHTIFSGISKLPPAHSLVWENGKSRLSSYWTLSYTPKMTGPSSTIYPAVLDKLRECVKIRLVSDVPLGAFLSGGLDSSCVVGLMSEISTERPQTFSVGFEEEEYSELPYARRVAERFRCDHHELIVRAERAEILPQLAWYYSEPFGDMSALPTFLIAQETRRHVTVALNGDGGDENFAGYLRYSAMGVMRWWNRLPLFMRKGLATVVKRLPERGAPLAFLRRIRRLIEIGALPLDQQYLACLWHTPESAKETLYTASFRDALTRGAPATDYLRRVLEEAQALELDWLDQLLYTDFRTYLPECLMIKMDIASMANSLETRSPFLDHELVEMAARLPPGMKFRPPNEKKRLLRESLKGWLPEEVRRREKQGFGIPVSAWFRDRLAGFLKETVLGPAALRRGYFQKEAIEKMVEEHQTGKKDWGYSLWVLLMLELWHQVYIDRTIAPPPSFPQGVRGNFAL